MIKLIPMSQEEYEPFMTISMHTQAQDQVKAGLLKADEADAKIAALGKKLLPEGLHTPNHHFFTLEDGETKQKVGALWYTIIEQDGIRMFFVMDILVNPEYRRHGYASQAFAEMEAKALDMGITRIALNVFDHNAPAIAMYEKLGYVGPHDFMVLDLTTRG